MPTAGEARLAKKKGINERSNRKPIKKAGTSLSTAPKVDKSAQSKTQNTRIVTKKHGKENIEPKKQGTKAKPAPDFSKLHSNWNSKFQKRKAVAKKPNTKVSPFVLTEVQTYDPLSSKNSDASDKENTEEEKEEDGQDDFGFEIDNNALQGILNNTGIQVQQEVHPQTRNTYAGTQISAPNTISGVSTKRTSIYYTGSKKTPTAPHQPLKNKGLTSNRPVYGFEAKLGKKQVVWADQDGGNDDEISFKPDASALESILNNKGIDERQTLGVRHTMASTRSVSFLQNSKRHSFLDSQPSKRTSIYYTGSKSKGVTTDLPRPSLIGRPRTSIIEKPTVPFSQRTTMTPTLKQQYVPGSTVIGKQDEEMENKGFEMHTFAKPFTPSHQEATNQVSKATDVKPCIRNTLMTPCRGGLDTRSQAPSTSKKQVSWSDVLTPHRGMDVVKPKEVILAASKEASSDVVDSSPWMKSATSTAYPSTLGESPVDDGTVALKLFSDDDTQQETNEKKEVELEELERQAIEELQLLEVEENQKSKESCKGFINMQARISSDISGCEPLNSPLQISNTPRNLKTTNFTDQWIRVTPQNHMRVTIRNKTPIASPFVRHMGTPGLLDPRSRIVPMASPRPLVNQTSGFQASVDYKATKAAPFVSQSSQSLIGVARQQQQQQQHQHQRPMEIGIQAPAGYAAPKPTPFMSQTGQGLTGMTRPVESGFQGPTSYAAPKPAPFMSQTGHGLTGMTRPVESGIQGPTGYAAPKATPFVSQTGQGLAYGALPTGKPKPFTPTQQVVQTPVMNGPLDTGQLSFGLPSSIKKSASGVGNKRSHSSTMISNPSFHKSLPWGDTFYSSTPSIEVVTSSLQEHSTTSNEHPNYRLVKNGLPTNDYRSHNIPSASHPTVFHDNRFYKLSELPSSSVHGTDFNEPAGKPLTRNFYQSAEQSFARCHANTFQKPAGFPWTSLHGNNFSEPAEKPLTSYNGNNSYMPAEKPLVSIHSNNFSKPAEKPLTVINERSLHGGNNLDEVLLGNDYVHNNGVSGLSWNGGHTQRAYTSSEIASSSKNDIASAPVTMNNLVQSYGHTGSKNLTYTNSLAMDKGTVVSIHSPAFIRQQPDTNFSKNADHLSKRPGISNGENRQKMLNTVSVPYTSRIHPNSDDSLSLRSAVGPLGLHRREPVMIKREVITVNRTTEETKNCPSLQNKSIDLRLPRSMETRNSLAQEALMDTEVALYTALGGRIKKRCTRDLSNPLAKIFEEGDSQHIVPICVCSDKIYCSVHPVFQSPSLVRRENFK